MSGYVSATDKIFNELREAILSGKLKPGELYSVYRVSDEMGISRTPVREAVLRLAEVDMVTIERNRGFTVRTVTVSDIREVFELRLMLEVPAAAHAATHGNQAFTDAVQVEINAMHEASLAGDQSLFMQHDLALHDLINGVLGNKRLSTTLRTLRESTRSRGVVTHAHSRGMAAIEDEHAPIVNALVARDPDAAAEYMRAHIVQTGILLMKQVAEVTNEAVPTGWASRFSPLPTL
jgi:DNA-binding GntR family transcriptional regulator